MPDESPYESIPAADIASGRILAAVAYLPALCFVGLFAAPGNRYVGFHARQGLLLFLAEIVGALVISLFDASLGAIPVVGFLASAILKFVLWFSFLGATVYGVIKGANGETARIPYLGDAIERLPL
jgi:uncharacterized membrane protein